MRHVILKEDAMKIGYLAGTALIAALGIGTAGAQQGAASPGTSTPAGVVQGTVAPPVGAPMTPPHPVGSRDEVQMLRLQPFSGMVPGMVARNAHDMGAGRPPTAMPPGSIAGQAPGMGGLRAPPR
jgi:hypothetical protein